MATLSETDLTKLSTESAEQFVDNYYAALNNARHQIKSFYVPTQNPPTGRQLPQISYNGELLNDAAVFQERYVKAMPYTYFDAQCVNVHVMNPSLTPVDNKSKREAMRNVSLVVQVSGAVRLVERKEGPLRGFSDNFVLVPNKEEAGGSGLSKQGQGRQWLIQSQNFRFVV